MCWMKTMHAKSKYISTEKITASQGVNLFQKCAEYYIVYSGVKLVLHIAMYIQIINKL